MPLLSVSLVSTVLPIIVVVLATTALLSHSCVYWSRWEDFHNIYHDSFNRTGVLVNRACFKESTGCVNNSIFPMSFSSPLPSPPLLPLPSPSLLPLPPFPFSPPPPLLSSPPPPLLPLLLFLPSLPPLPQRSLCCWCSSYSYFSLQ